ncbi:LacI family DNA-binding transcriptional regulator [Alloscardovia venturai]|uniref:LacI family DNA-binding transcriptional regulator n=1 Tax=Alloscardovia venturai TaxID=1769421 RepID=A0ABW2Y787_9BIFI
MESTIQTVATAANVSISTVSRAFTHPELVSEKTRKRIMDIAVEQGFSLSRSATALKTGKSLRIALLMSGKLNLWFISSVIEGLNDVFHDSGYDISIFQISSAEERKKFFTELPLRRNADAVIVTSFGIDANEVKRLGSIGIPIIGINSDYPRERGFTAAVNINDDKGSQLAARHLIQLGHKDIAYISTHREVSLHFSVQERINSFIEYCHEYGAHITQIPCNIDEDGIYRIGEVASRLLSLENFPTAVACQEDGIAIPLQFQLQRNGLSVPENISLIGYDDAAFSSDLGLTTIHQDPVAMAQKAARMTLQLINGEELTEPFVVEPAELVVRSSTTHPLS